MTLEGRRVFFISYDGMLDPLGQSQVIPYLRELAKMGVHFTLLSFERASAFGTEGLDRCEDLKRQLVEAGIEWHWLRYHQKPSLPALAIPMRSSRVRRWARWLAISPNSNT